MVAVHWLLPVTLLAAASCQPPKPVRVSNATSRPNSHAPPSRGEPSDPPLGHAWFNTTTNVVDPRFADLPARIGRDDLTPHTTLLAQAPTGTRSVRFSID